MPDKSPPEWVCGGCNAAVPGGASHQCGPVLPDKEQSPSVTVLSSVCGVHFREECRGCISAKESNDERFDALLAEREKLTKQLRDLAVALHAKHYAEVVQWEPLGEPIGILSQIDNMTTGLTRAAPSIGETDYCGIVEVDEEGK